MAKRRVFLFFLSVILLTGCATWKELNDPWLRSEQIDFKNYGAVFGQVVVYGYSPGPWRLQGYLENLDNGKKDALVWSQDGFFFKVVPGKYQLHILRAVWNSIAGYPYYQSAESVDFDFVSQVYNVKAGEAVYAGDLFINLSKPGQITDTGGFLTFITVSRNISIASGVKDKSYEKLKLLKRRHPAADYNFLIQLMEIRKG